MFASLLKNKLKTLVFFNFFFFWLVTGKHCDLINLHPESCGQQLTFCTITPPPKFQLPTSPLCSPPRSHCASLLSPTLLHSYYNTHFSLSPPSGTFWSAPHFDVKVLSGKLVPHRSVLAKQSCSLPLGMELIFLVFYLIQLFLLLFDTHPAVCLRLDLFCCLRWFFDLCLLIWFHFKLKSQKTT